MRTSSTYNKKHSEIKSFRETPAEESKSTTAMVNTTTVHSKPSSSVSTMPHIPHSQESAQAISMLESGDDNMTLSVEESSFLSSSQESILDTHGMKYVGAEARSLFFDRMKFMSHHNQISKHKSEQKTTELHFECHDKHNDDALDHYINTTSDTYSVEPSTTRSKPISQQYLSNTNLSSETPRGLASLILNSALPPIIISGPSKGKSPASRAVYTRDISPTRDDLPKSCPTTASNKTRNKFDFSAMKNNSNSSSNSGDSNNNNKNTNSKKTPTNKAPARYHHLASLILSEDEDDETSQLLNQQSQSQQKQQLLQKRSLSSNQLETTVPSDSLTTWSTSSSFSPFPSKLQDTLIKYNSQRGGDMTNIQQQLASSSSCSSTNVSPINGGKPLSPRSKFISKCLEKKMHPRASVILRKGLDHKTMDLHHMGLGNDMTCILAECMTDLPYDIESINLNNNGLDGRSIAPLLRSMETLSSIVSLNLSYNIMDKVAISALAEYFLSTNDSEISSHSNNSFMVNNSKSLQTLILQHTDIDDNDADKILHSLMNNTTLTEIDFSNNKIGSSENRRSIQSNYITFTEALAEAIKKKSCPLKTLNLSWNTIRLTSAVAFTKAIGMNSSLTYLDLSYNSLGCDAGEQLGDSLLENNTKLETLLLNHNSINSSAAFALAIGIMESKSLRRVALDDNPIGENGARALMAVPMSVGGRVKLTLSGCNVTIKENSSNSKGSGICWYNASDPLGIYALDLSRPYERAIAFSILQIAANHSTYIIQSAVYQREKGVNSFEELELHQAILEDHNAILDERQQRIVTELRKICVAASDSRRAKDLFHEIDTDGSGQIDRLEFQELLGRMGIEVATDWIDDVMKPYDLDESGNIDLQEFMAFLASQYEEAKGRIEDLTQTRVMNLSGITSCSSASGGLGNTLTPSTAKPWETNARLRTKLANSRSTSKMITSSGRYIPPKSGILHIKLIDGFYKKSFYSTVRTFDHHYAKEIAISMNSGVSMMEYAIKNSKLRLSEAVALYYSMDAESSIEPMTILAKLVVLLDDPYDAKKMIRRMTKGDKGRLFMLKSQLGTIIRPILGIQNGFYSLDLNKEFDRLCLSRLFEHNYYCMQLRQQQDGYAHILGGPGTIGDTSQIHDRWSCFRNSVYNDETVELPSETFYPIPQTGKLSFDFSSTARPKLVIASGIESIAAHSVLLTDMRCIKILRRVFNFNIEQVAHGLEKLNELRKTMKKVNKIPGRTYYTHDKNKAQAIGGHIEDFYHNLQERSNLVRDGVEKEIIKIDVRRSKSVGATDDDDGQILSPRSMVNLGSPRRIVNNTLHSPTASSRNRIAVTINSVTSSTIQKPIDLKAIIETTKDGINTSALSPIRNKTGNMKEGKSPAKKDSVSIRSPVSLLGLDQDHTKSSITRKDDKQHYISPSHSNNISNNSNNNTATLQEKQSSSFFPGIETSSGLSNLTTGTTGLSSSLSKPKSLSNKLSPSKFMMSQSTNSLSDILVSGGGVGGIVGLAASNGSTLSMDQHGFSSSSSSGHDQQSMDTSGGYYDFDIVKRKSFKATSIYSISGSFAPISAGTHYVIPRKQHSRKLPNLSTVSPKGSLKLPAAKRGTLTRKGTEDVIFEHSLTNKGLSEDVQNLRNILNSSYLSQQAKGAAVLDMLLDILGACGGILCRHIVIILHYFPWGSAFRAPYFGSYHVELIVSLFPKIADLYNFEMILKQLTSLDCAALYCRIGWLNIFNPMKLDGFWELNFGRYEERQIIKILIASSKLEAGENWIEKSFRWQRGMDEVPAWDITVTYMADTTCPNKGILLVKYYSGSGVGKQGCKPNVALRKALMSLVLLDEDDQLKVEKIDQDEEEDLDEEGEEEDEKIDVEVVVPRSNVSSNLAITNTVSSSATTRHSSIIPSIQGKDGNNSSNTTLPLLDTSFMIQSNLSIGLGFGSRTNSPSKTIKNNNTNTTIAISLREGEKFMEANKSWWDTLLIYNKSKKSVYGTHGTRVTHLTVGGIGVG